MLQIFMILCLILQIFATNVEQQQQHLPQHTLSAYCYTQKNVTVYKLITKTRTVTVQRKFLGFPMKPKQRTEEYEEETPVIMLDVIKTCCAGYQMDKEAGICRALCEPACPAYSKCERPQQCRCEFGYKPTYLNEEMQCEAITDTEIVSTSTNTASTEELHITDEATTIQYDVDLVSEANVAVTSFKWDLTYDCRLNECPQHAECLGNGSCACLAGYQWHEVTAEPSESNEGILMRETFCLQANETLEQNQNLSYTLIMAYCLGVVLVIIAVAVILRLALRQTKTLPIGTGTGADNPHCQYMIKHDELADSFVY